MLMRSEDETSLWFTGPHLIPSPFIQWGWSKDGCRLARRLQIRGFQETLRLISALFSFRCQEVKRRHRLKVTVFVCFTIMISLSLPVKRGFTFVWVWTLFCVFLPNCCAHYERVTAHIFVYSCGVFDAHIVFYLIIAIFLLIQYYLSQIFSISMSFFASGDMLPSSGNVMYCTQMTVVQCVACF